jgi:Fe-S cluster assembly iron-binding protein IscA
MNSGTKVSATVYNETVDNIRLRVKVKSNGTSNTVGTVVIEQTVGQLHE